MKLTKKQVKFIGLVEKSKFLFVGEVDQSQYPLSMIKSLEGKGAISIFKHKITSNLI